VRFGFSVNKKEVLAIGLLCLVGLIAVLQVSASAVARVSGIAPGIVSVLLCAVLMLGGVYWLFNSRLSPDEDEDADIGPSIWRGTCGVASGAFSFVLLYKYGGLLPAVMSGVFIAILGDHRHSVRSAGLWAAGLAFIVALAAAMIPNVAVPMFRWG